jgi:hypothetical protein
VFGENFSTMDIETIEINNYQTPIAVSLAYGEIEKIYF